MPRRSHHHHHQQQQQRVVAESERALIVTLLRILIMRAHASAREEEAIRVIGFIKVLALIAMLSSAPSN